MKQDSQVYYKAYPLSEIYRIREDNDGSTSPRSLDSDLDIDAKNTNNWITVNHDIYGTRHSNQTIINKDNVATLHVKWILINDHEIQEPPIIIGNKGYVQDYAGTVIAFDAATGRVLWKVKLGNGPTMGLTYSNAIVYAVQRTTIQWLQLMQQMVKLSGSRKL